MCLEIEGKTVEDHIDWAVRRLHNLSNTVKDGTKNNIAAVLIEAKKEITRLKLDLNKFMYEVTEQGDAVWTSEPTNRSEDIKS